MAFASLFLEIPNMYDLAPDLMRSAHVDNLFSILPVIVHYFLVSICYKHCFVTCFMSGVCADAHAYI